jgi:hypothetical protein
MALHQHEGGDRGDRSEQDRAPRGARRAAQQRDVVARAECEDEPRQCHRDRGSPAPAEEKPGEGADDRGREEQLDDEVLGHSAHAAAGRQVARLGVEQRRAELGGDERGCERHADEAEEREMGPWSRWQPVADLSVCPADREAAQHGGHEPRNEDEPDRHDPEVVEDEEDEQADDAREHAGSQRRAHVAARRPQLARRGVGLGGLCAMAPVGHRRLDGAPHALFLARLT